MEDRYLLISDVDGTLLGDDDRLLEFSQWYAARRDRVKLVYNSGRFVDSILESIEATDLPQPDAIIGGVGTQIECFTSEAAVDRWPATADGWQPSRICSVLSEFDELQMQPAELLSEYKISYFAHNVSDERIDEIQERLAAECRAALIYSSDRDLDVVPEGVDKGSAAAHLARKWSFPGERVIVAGDTGNDLAMFQNGFRGIVVGNARDELKRLESPSIFHARHCHAAGVLEGMRHWLHFDTTAATRECDSVS